MQSCGSRAALKGHLHYSTPQIIHQFWIIRPYNLNSLDGARLAAYRPQASESDLVQALLSELRATRQQVDRLLDHQELLLGMLQLQHQTQLRAPSHGSSNIPLAPSNSILDDIANSQDTNGSNSMANSDDSNSSSVVQVLASLGVGTASSAQGTTSPAGSLITEALKRASQQDVLQEESSEPAESAPSSSAAAASAASSSIQHHELQLPVLEPGMRHAWWMEQLHVALLARGYYAGDQDVQSWMFGTGTAEALQRFQKDAGIALTGVTDATTWAAILSELPKMEADIAHALAMGKAPPAPSAAAPSSSAAQASEAVTTFDQQPLQSAEVGQANTQGGSALPRLQAGDGLQDDTELKWVSRLHRALMTAGLYPPEDECEDWLFGEGTREAVLTAQATAGLDETGVVCPSTWSWLLRHPDGDAVVRAEVEEELGFSIHTSARSTVSQEPAADSSEMKAPNQDSMSTADAWPVLVEGDGGAAVGVLQQALQATGYHCGDDEPTYWQFGADTSNALRTFQACSSLPESGVCDKSTWRSLLKALGVNNISSITELQQHLKSIAGDEDEADIVQGQQHGRVWLLGEQRWEVRT